jgi:hypothetical protein
MNKFDYVKSKCYIDYDAKEGVITNEEIIGTFAGRSFNCSSLDDGVQNIVDYFDGEQRVKYQGRTTSMVQDALKEIGWGTTIV